MGKNRWTSKFAMGLMVVLVAIGAGFSPAFAADSYPDVKSDSSHYEAIIALSEQGFVKGYEDGKYRPAAGITRQQVAVILQRAYDLEIPEDVAGVLEAYDDVTAKHMYAGEIAAVTEAGIFKGSNGKFMPQEMISREQTASVILRAEGLVNYETVVEVEINLDNVNPSHEATVQVLADLGVTNQLSDYRPKEDVSRGQFASLLYRLMEKADEIEGLFSLDVMHTSDTHAHLETVAKRVTAVENFRETYPEALLFDSGDVFSGTLYFNEYRGQADIKFMNYMGYDAMTFGNHEFDLGEADGHHKRLAEFIEAANFPFVSSNVDVSADADLSPLYTGGVSEDPKASEIYDGLVYEINGEKVGVFALTTEETADISSPLDVTFENYIESATEMVQAFEAEGIDKIVVLSHLGYRDNPESNDIRLAKEVDGIDVILGGHSHTELEKPVLIIEDEDGNAKEPTLISHTFQYANFLGTLNVDFDEDGVIVGCEGQLVSISDQKDDAEAAEMLKAYSETVDQIMEEEIGATALAELENPRGDVSVRNSETALGNLITNGMLDQAKRVNSDVVMAVTNAGGIRAAINEGPITTGEVMTVLPFGNTVATIQLTGAELIEALEHGVRLAPGENGGFLQVSGLRYEYDSSLPAGERVVSVEVQDGDSFVALDEEAEYVIATNMYIAKGGDGFDVFETAYDDGRVQDLGISDWENFRNYLIKHAEENDGKIEVKTEGRITDVAE